MNDAVSVLKYVCTRSSFKVLLPEAKSRQNEYILRIRYEMHVARSRHRPVRNPDVNDKKYSYKVVMT